MIIKNIIGYEIKKYKIYNENNNKTNNKNNDNRDNDKIKDNSGREKLLGQHPLCEQAIDSTPVSKS